MLVFEFRHNSHVFWKIFQLHVILFNVYDVMNMHGNGVIMCIYTMILIVSCYFLIVSSFYICYFIWPVMIMLFYK